MESEGKNGTVWKAWRVVPAFLAFLLAGILMATLISAADSATVLTPPQAPIPASYFDLNILFYPGAKVPWPSVPFYGWRAWHALWYDLEPQKGQWNFKHLDDLVQMSHDHHSELLLILSYAPAWAAKGQDPKSDWQAGTSGPIADPEDWRNYVRTVGTRYRGKIKTYEIWNEPDRQHAWAGDMDTMLEMTKEAHNILKEIDPTVTIVSPSATYPKGSAWLNEFLKKGGGQYVDVIGFHFYPNGDTESAAPEAMISLIQGVRTVMENNHAGEMPLWNTEAGWHIPRPFPSEELAAAYVARAYILNWAAGVSRFYWYCWDNHNWTSLELTEPDNSILRPAGKAYATIQDWLTGASMKRVSSNQGGNWVVELKRGERREFIVWNERGQGTFSVPGEWQVSRATYLSGESTSLQGGSLAVGVQPVLVH